MRFRHQPSSTRFERGRGHSRESTNGRYAGERLQRDTGSEVYAIRDVLVKDQLEFEMKLTPEVRREEKTKMRRVAKPISHLALLARAPCPKP